VLWFVDYFPNTVLGMRADVISGATRSVAADIFEPMSRDDL
jgi:hypothetical protein